MNKLFDAGILTSIVIAFLIGISLLAVLSIQVYDRIMYGPNYMYIGNITYVNNGIAEDEQFHTESMPQ